MAGNSDSNPGMVTEADRRKLVTVDWLSQYMSNALETMKLDITNHIDATNAPLKA